jgi:hypothetical protein
MEEQSR